MRKREPTPSSNSTNYPHDRPSIPQTRQAYGYGTPYDDPYEEVTI